MVDAKTIKVKILEKEYQVSCEPEEVDELRQSAHYVHDKMKEIKTNSSVVGLERLAVMVSLNIANDLLREKDKVLGVKSAQDNSVMVLAGKVEKALLRIKDKEN
ncbi:MAG: cell division protein ZapA [Gammaproteobacteria bacterium TMED1]|jgi:cell division protein ZapA|nr:MAG: cell division protein ZapA [Gammaproteobacteria bacterium TMED1]|tara:strand:- start:881 stop:1192 length:312 start_codon:yes stop_codon:yes gene_type:complete